MRLMLYEWDAFMQTDMEDVLRRMNIDYRVFWYPFIPKLTDEDAYFEKHFCEALAAGEYDAVFSFNFKSVVAKCCDRMHVPYMAWVFDSPFGISEREDILRLPMNHIFIFDRYVYRQLKARGIDTVYHLPLAVNLERLDQIRLSDSDRKKFGADVSFVGTLYPSTFGGFRARLPEYELGQVESVIGATMKIYGGYFLDRFTEGDMCRRIRRVLENEEGYDRIFHESLQSILAKEVTRRERLTLLYLLSMDHRVALYSNASEEMLERVDFRGVISSFDEVYRVYKASKINLNISFKRIVEGMPLRVMDIMGAGGFLLSNYQPELVEEFEPGVDLVVYESIEEAVALAKYYLEHEEERKEIAAHGHEKMKRYTFEKQLEKMFAVVFSEKNGVDVLADEGGLAAESDLIAEDSTVAEDEAFLDGLTAGMKEYTKGYLAQLIRVWQVIGDPAILTETLTDDVVEEAIRVWGEPEGLTENPYERMLYVAEEIERRSVLQG